MRGSTAGGVSMAFGAHLLATLAPARQGRVEVIYCDPLRVADFADRKALARAAEIAVRSAHVAALPTRV